MGNALALKIKHIHDTNLLKAVRWGHDEKLLPFVHFITKINGYYVENLRKGMIISEFTLLNFITRKEAKIRIERVESKLFFEALIFSLEVIPSVSSLLMVTKVVRDGLADSKGVKEKMILLGGEGRYFQAFADVEEAIRKQEKLFVFYEFEEGKVNLIEFRGEDATLGFECEVVTLPEIAKLIEKKAEKDFSGRVFKNRDKDDLNFTVENVKNYNNNENDKNITYINEESINCTDSLDLSHQKKILNPTAEFTNPSPCEDQPANKQIFNQISTQNKEKEIDFDSEPCPIDSHLEYKFVDSKNNFELTINDLEDDLQSETSKNNFEVELPLCQGHTNMKSPKNSICLFEEEEVVTLVTPNTKEEYTGSATENYHNQNTLPDRCTTSSINSREEQIPMPQEQITSLNRTRSFGLSKIKKKYAQRLSIYENLDSNYNFMNLHVDPLPSQKVILIKGFLLCEEGVMPQPRLSSLELNTIDVN